jgi:hypothetical protein
MTPITGILTVTIFTLSQELFFISVYIWLYSCLIPQFVYFYFYVYVFLLYVYVPSSCQLTLFGYPD